MSPHDVAARIRELEERIARIDKRLARGWLDGLHKVEIDAMKRSARAARREIWELRNPQLARAFAR